MPAEDWWCATLLVVCSSPHSTPCRPLPRSTNSVYDDIERGRSWQGVESGQVDLSELTWEQKEQVLRCVHLGG